MQLFYAFGLLAIAVVTFSCAGPIDKLNDSVQLQVTNQLLTTPNVNEGEEVLDGGERKPCIPGGEFDSDCDEIEGTAGIDYPAYPYETILLAFKFNCSEQVYSGFYADPDYGCQIYHICADGQQWTSMCNNGTIFDQKIRNCVFYKNFDCKIAVSQYDVNVDSFQPPVCLSLNGLETNDTQVNSLDQKEI